MYLKKVHGESSIILLASFHYFFCYSLFLSFLHPLYAHSQNCEKLPLASSCSFVRPTVFLPVRIEQVGFKWTDFHEIWHYRISKKSAEKIQVWLNSEKNNGYLAWRCAFVMISRSVPLRMRNVSDKSCRENQNTNLKFNKCFPKIVPFMR